MASTSVVLLSSLFVTVLTFLLLPDYLCSWSWDELLLGQKIGIVYDVNANVVHIERTYLTMEPIVSLFLLFVGVVVIFQFSTMVFHRLQTLGFLLQIIENFTKRTKENTEKWHIEDVKELRKSNIKDLGENREPRRHTLRNLERDRGSKQASRNVNLDSVAKSKTE